MVYEPAAVARVRGYLTSPEAAAEHTRTLLDQFSSSAQKRLVREVLQDFLGCDGSIGPEEAILLNEMR